MNKLTFSLMICSTLTLLLACSDDYSDSDDEGTEVETPVDDGDTDAGVDDTEDDTEDDDETDESDNDDSDISDEVHPAFAAFEEDNVLVYLDGDEVVIETNGLPNHTSPYWSSPFHAGRPSSTVPTESHPLFVEPTVTSYAQMAPGYIDDFDGLYTLRLPVEPQLAANSSATGLGAIGIAISGSVIYNDEEGPGIPIDGAVGSLDYVGAHTGPQSYHYHLEPTAWSEDDDELIGVIADGFFLYGRKCAATGDYPTDLDESGGHASVTQHSASAEYHYHIQNEAYLGSYYILFPGNYQGTANAIQ